MTSNDIRKACSLLDRIEGVNTAIELVTNKLGVTFQGQYQNETILNLVRPVLLQHFIDQRSALEQQLIDMGVEP